VVSGYHSTQDSILTPSSPCPSLPISSMRARAPTSLPINPGMAGAEKDGRPLPPPRLHTRSAPERSWRTRLEWRRISMSQRKSRI